MEKIILGSASERRRKILQYFTLPFEQIPSRFDEALVPFTGSVEAYVELVAKKKAEHLTKKYPDRVLLCADTAVAVHKKLFTKPQNEAQALQMLYEISGSWHEVFTGVCVGKNGQFFSGCELTRILFHTLSEAEIETYHKKCYFPDAAGGYDITKAGGIIVKKIEGCFYNVMGLPITLTKELLQKVGINLWDYLG